MSDIQVANILAKVAASNPDATSFPPSVQQASSGLLRRLAVKLRPGTLGKHEVCRPAIAIELACRMCQFMNYSRETLIQQSMVKEAVFRDVLRKAEDALGLQLSHSVEQLAIKMGGGRAVDPAKRLLAEFQRRYLETIMESQRASINFKTPVYPAAAFFLAGKKLQMKIDRKQLLDISGASSAELNIICKSMESTCADLTGSTNQQKKQRSSPGGGAAAAAAAAAVKKNRAINGGAGAAGHSSSNEFVFPSQESVPTSQAEGGSTQQRRRSSGSSSSLFLLPPRGSATKRGRSPGHVIMSAKATASSANSTAGRPSPSSSSSASTKPSPRPPIESAAGQKRPAATITSPKGIGGGGIMADNGSASGPKSSSSGSNSLMMRRNPLAGRGSGEGSARLPSLGSSNSTTDREDDRADDMTRRGEKRPRILLLMFNNEADQIEWDQWKQKVLAAHHTCTAPASSNRSSTSAGGKIRGAAR